MNDVIDKFLNSRKATLKHVRRSRITNGAEPSCKNGRCRPRPVKVKPHPSGLSGEHSVVLDAIQSECLHQ